MHALYHIKMIGGLLVLMHLHESLVLDAAANVTHGVLLGP